MSNENKSKAEVFAKKILDCGLHQVIAELQLYKESLGKISIRSLDNDVEETVIKLALNDVEKMIQSMECFRNTINLSVALHKDDD